MVFKRSDDDFGVRNDFNKVILVEFKVSEPNFRQDNGQACVSNSDYLSNIFVWHIFFSAFTHVQTIVFICLYGIFDTCQTRPVRAYTQALSEATPFPKKIENMLRQGIPSKIYWYAFPEPVSGYEIAKRIYKPITGRAETSKIYPYTKAMIGKNIISSINNKIQSNPETMVLEIEDTLRLKKVSLSAVEKKRVLRILQNDFFKEMILTTIKREIKKREEIDAAKDLMQILGICSIIQYPKSRSAKNIVEKVGEEFKCSFKEFEKPIFREYSSKDPIENFLNYLSIDLPKKLIMLLPLDMEEIWNTIEATQKKIIMQKCQA